jgi:hypothetical protein
MMQASRLSCQDSSAECQGKQKTMILRNGRSFQSRARRPVALEMTIPVCHSFPFERQARSIPALGLRFKHVKGPK